MMRRYLALAVWLVIVITTAVFSPTVALQVTISSPRSSFVEGEPVYVWVDYYNDTGEEVGLPNWCLFGFDVLKVRTRDGEMVLRAGQQVTRAPRGRSNEIQQVGPREHVVLFANLLDHVNLTEADSYDIQIVMSNQAPESLLDPENPALPASKLVHGPIQSNHWEFTITPGSGESFDLVAKPLREKTAGTFGLCQNATLIVEKYLSSPYGPYAVMCEVDRLLYGEGQGPVPLKDRLPSAEALVKELRRVRPGFEYLDIALIRYAERLGRVGQIETASKLLSKLQREEHNEVGRLYIGKLLSGLPGTK